MKASTNKSAIVVGATGVVGLELVKQLCASDAYSKVTCLARRAIESNHDKLTQHIVNFDNPKNWQDLVYADSLFCAIGTTLRQAGDKATQKRIDLDLPMAIANIAKTNGVKSFALVSSTGADAASSSFYLSLKGELEQGLEDLGFNALTIVQPSVLDAKRKEFRFGEEIAIKMLKALQFIPALKPYRPITPEQVAKALIYFQQKNDKGTAVKKLNELFI